MESLDAPKNLCQAKVSIYPAVYDQNPAEKSARHPQQTQYKLPPRTSTSYRCSSGRPTSTPTEELLDAMAAEMSSSRGPGSSLTHTEVPRTYGEITL